MTGVTVPNQMATKDMKANPDSVFSLAGKTANKINSLDVPQEMIDEVNKNSNHPYWSAIEGIFAPKTEVKVKADPFAEWREGIINLYMKYMKHDIRPDLKKFWFPKNPPANFNWCVYRPEGMTTRIALDRLCKPQFKVVECIKVDEYPLERKSDASHLVLCRETIEPDAEWLGQSGDDMANISTSFLDLCDRVILEAIYFSIKKKHLDIKGDTRCPRSRWRGSLASVRSCPSPRGLLVRADHQDFRIPNHGGRQAFVLPRMAS